MTLVIPEFALIILIGTTGSGKTTFAKRHFKSSEILSSSHLRALIAGREDAIEVAAEAFELLLSIAGKRLARRLLTVIDASNLLPEVRKALLALAKDWDVMPIALVFAPPEPVRNSTLSHRYGPALLSHQRLQFQQTMRLLPYENFACIHVFENYEASENETVRRRPLGCDRHDLSGPFDIIGDVHGCWEELIELFDCLGYTFTSKNGSLRVVPPNGRKALFLGDLIDRGPGSLESLLCAIEMVKHGDALMLPGNHEEKLIRHLSGKKVTPDHGFQETMQALEESSPELQQELLHFLKALPSHYVLDQGRLVAAHAGMKERYQGRDSGRVRAFALYGATTGERDEFGLPIRSNWALDYWGRALVVYGHTPVRQPLWLNRSVNIDTGCVFGGSLSALRYPELTIVSVPAKQVYTQPKKFLEISEDESASQQERDLIDPIDPTLPADTLIGPLFCNPGNIDFPLEALGSSPLDLQALSSLPIKYSHFATGHEALKEAFDYYLSHGIKRLYCRQRMGGLQVLILLCRNERIAKKRFHLYSPTIGICYNQQLQEPFLPYHLLGIQFFERLHEAVSRAYLWERLETSWLLLEGELFPLSMAHSPLSSSKSYLEHDWPLQGVDSLRFYPTHFHASENQHLLEQAIDWQEEVLSALRHQDPHLLRAPHSIVVHLKEAYSKESAMQWWSTLIDEGGEGCYLYATQSPIQLIHQRVLPVLYCQAHEGQEEKEEKVFNAELFFESFALTHSVIAELLHGSPLSKRLQIFFNLMTKY